MAVLAIPAISARARRLAEKKARLQAPLSETQARAERDALRGQHAVEIVKLEKRLSASERERALGAAAVGRLSTSILELEASAARDRDEIAAQRAEISGLGADVHDRGAQLLGLQIGLLDMETQRDRVVAALSTSRGRVLDLETAADESRTRIAMLETRATGLEIELADSRRLLSEQTSQRMKSEHSASDMAAKLAELEHASEALKTVRADFARSERDREDAVLENGRQLGRIAEAESALSRAEAARADLERRLAATELAGRGQVDTFAERLQSLTTSLAVAEGALGVERASRATLFTELEAARAHAAEAESRAIALADGDKALRAAIARLGREILETRGGSPEPAETGQVVSFRRDLVAPAHGDPAAHRPETPIASEG